MKVQGVLFASFFAASLAIELPVDFRKVFQADCGSEEGVENLVKCVNDVLIPTAQDLNALDNSVDPCPLVEEGYVGVISCTVNCDGVECDADTVNSFFDSYLLDLEFSGIELTLIDQCNSPADINAFCTAVGDGTPFDAAHGVRASTALIAATAGVVAYLN